MRRFAPHISVVAFLLLIVVGLGGCKPSENNYRKAYETAMGNRYNSVDSATLLLMEAEALPKYIYAGGDSARARVVALMRPRGENDSLWVRRYNVVVGMFRMAANAASQRERLSSAGFPAFMAVDGGNTYYVFACATDSLGKASGFIRDYVTRNPGTWVGIPEPYVIVPHGYR